MPQITSVIDRTVASIERDMGTKRNNSSSNDVNGNVHNNGTSGSQYASHPQHNPITAVKQEGYSPSAHRRPSLRSNSTTPNSIMSGTEQIPIHRTTGMTNTSYYNPPMTSPSTAYPQMGYADLTQSALPAPSTTASTMQSSYIPPVTEESAHHQYLYATSAAASAAAAQMAHNTPGNSPQAVAASHNPMVTYNPQSATPTPNHHHQQQATAGWMNGGPAAPNGMSAVQHVPNGANTWSEWTNAIALGVPPSSQDRYNAGALLTLGSGQRGPNDPGGGGGGGGDMGAGPGQHAAVPEGQWSMMMTYHNPNHAGG